MSLTHALKWAYLSELASKAISPIVFIVLARLLTPEDYGVMAAALMVMAFSQIFWEAGMGKALIQRQTDTNPAANVAFWINIGLGIIVAGLLFIASEPIAQTFFHDNRVTAVIQVMTLQVFLGAISSVHTTLLQKNMGFKKLFWVRFATVGLPGIASIPLAWNGMGYWALVLGTLVGQATQVIMLWYTSQWRPKLTFDLKVAREMALFAAWVGASGFMSWFFSTVDALIVGMYLGVHELGIFRTGNQIPILIFGALFGPITSVLYSHLVRMNQNKERMRNAAVRLIKTLTFIAIPVAVTIFQLSEPIGSALLGEKWNGVGYVIGVMALVHGFSWVVGMNGEIYRAMGKPSYETVMAGTTMVIYIAVYMYSIQYGLEVFLWARLSMTLLGMTVHLFFLKKLLSISIESVVSYIILIATISYLSVFVVNQIITNNIIGAWPQTIVGGLVSLVLLAGTLFVLERNGIVKELKLMIKAHAT